MYAPNKKKKKNIKICESKSNRPAWRYRQIHYIIGDFNTPLSKIENSRRQKISKDKDDLNSPMNKLDLIDIYRLLHLKTIEYTFLSSSHGRFTRTDNIMRHKYF